MLKNPLQTRAIFRHLNTNMIDPGNNATPINKLLEKLKGTNNDETAESGISMTASPSIEIKERLHLSIHYNEIFNWDISPFQTISPLVQDNHHKMEIDEEIEKDFVKERV